MPKFGWKCFIGSFLMSLGAVFMATKAHFALSEREKQNVPEFSDIQAKNIELFAQYDDGEAERYEKFNRVSKTLEPNNTSDLLLVSEKEVKNAPKKITLAENSKLTDNSMLPPAKSTQNGVLYAPEDDDDTDFSIAPTSEADTSLPSLNVAKDTSSDINSDINENNDKVLLADANIGEPENILLASTQVENDKSTDFENDDISDVAEDLAKETATGKEEVAIADASEFKPFTIPLVHNFDVAENEVAISNQANKSQIALASQNVHLNNLGTENKASVTTDIVSSLNKKDKQFVSSRQYDDGKDSPWTVAETSNPHISKNKIEKFVEENKDELNDLNIGNKAVASSENETKVAYKMTKNILIPIPEDIMKEENLTPQLAYSEENKKLNAKLQNQNILPKPTETETKININNEPVAPENVTKLDVMDKDKTLVEDNATQTTLIPENKEQSSKSLTQSIADWFSGSESKSTKDTKNSISEEVNDSDSSSAFSKLLNLGSSKKKKNNIVPSELKLAFQPNRAEISGQTLEWLHAFSENVIKNENVLIEIRIDGSNSFELQQKRLNLLYSILANNGVEANKINIIFTEREPNSFIIRNVRYATEEEMANARKKNSFNPWY